MYKRVLGCVGMAVLAIAGAARGESGLRAQGVLDGIKPEVSGLITLKFDSARVRLDRSVWGDDKPKGDDAEEVEGGPVNINLGGAVQIRNMRARVQSMPAEAALRRVQNAAQASESSGMTSNRSRAVTFSGASLSGRLEVSGEVVAIQLKENAAPGRTIELTEDPEGLLRLMLTSNDGDIIVINQAPGGATSLACVMDGKSHVASAKTFAEAFSKNRDVFEKVVFPALQHVGIGLSLSANTPQVRAALVSMLTPLSDEETQAAQKLLTDLASDDFATRESAREKLSAGIDRYRLMVQKHAKRDDVSKDMQFTLEQLLAAADVEPNRKLIAEMKLLDDPKFLVSILDALEPEQRKIITAHLEKLTGQSLGDDVAAWQKWAEQN